MKYGTSDQNGSRARRLQGVVLSGLAAVLLSSCGTSRAHREIVVSVKDQKAALYERGEPVRVYGISTSKFGLGDELNSCRTPTGKLRIVRKIGHGMPPGMVFKSRRPTGEILAPNSPGRDPVVTRILWLAGMEGKNRNTMRRFVYIHGTPEEGKIGTPASYGCVRMRSMDVIDLFNRTPVGTPVVIERGGLPMEAKFQKEYVYQPPSRPERGPGRLGRPETAVAKR
jgi:lipoprotein-anchoring transpeptidase ErfK/SrfK